MLFAASNSAVLASLSPEATAKNVLTVGATQDGLDAHLVKIQGRADEVLGDVFPLFDGMDGRSCAALVDAALLPNLLSFDFTGCPAEASLTPSTCSPAPPSWCTAAGGASCSKEEELGASLLLLQAAVE